MNVDTRSWADYQPWLQAILDEYARAIRDLQAAVQPLQQEGYLSATELSDDEFPAIREIMEHVVGGNKQYMMDITLGVTTSTYDAEGEVIKTGDSSGVTLQAVESELTAFVGNIQQTPPMYSAVKVGGQRLYKLARAGLRPAWLRGCHLHRRRRR